MAIDRSPYSNTISSPARSHLAVVKSDTVEFKYVTKALYIGTGGDVVLRGIDDDQDVTYKNVPSGAYLEVACKIVKTATTATDILAIY